MLGGLREWNELSSEDKTALLCQKCESSYFVIANLDINACLPNNKNFPHNAVSIVSIKTRNIVSE
jgi:hypothetical protein